MLCQIFECLPTIPHTCIYSILENPTSLCRSFVVGLLSSTLQCLGYAWFLIEASILLIVILLGLSLHFLLSISQYTSSLFLQPLLYNVCVLKCTSLGAIECCSLLSCYFTSFYKLMLVLFSSFFSVCRSYRRREDHHHHYGTQWVRPVWEGRRETQDIAKISREPLTMAKPMRGVRGYAYSSWRFHGSWSQPFDTTCPPL